MNKINSICDIFDNKGNWIIPIDPYRVPDDNEVYKYLFEDDGYVNDKAHAEAMEYANKIQPNWNTPLVKYIYSELIDSGCHANYTAKYAWRH